TATSFDEAELAQSPPERVDATSVEGKVTLLAPKGASPAEALELLKSELALHGYTLLSRAEGIWIVAAERVVSEVFTIKVVPLMYARAGEVAYALSWVAPPSVRIVPYTRPTASSSRDIRGRWRD